MLRQVEPDMPQSHYIALVHDNLASLATIAGSSLVWMLDDKHLQVMVALASIVCATTLSIRNIMAMWRGKP